MATPTPGGTQNSTAPAATPWAHELIDSYESNAASQFLIHGNVNDRMLVPTNGGVRLGSLTEYLLSALLSRFEVVLSYDLGNGIRVEKGREIFAQWPSAKDGVPLPRNPRSCVEALSHYFRYCANLSRLNQSVVHVACIVSGVDLLAPRSNGGADFELSAMASLIRDWANDALLQQHPLATFLVAENLNDVHPLIVNNPRAARIRVPLPDAALLQQALRLVRSDYPVALANYAPNINALAEQLAGATLGAIESMLKVAEHRKHALGADDVVKLKKQLVENDCNGLIEFIESRRSFQDLYGLESVKAWLKQDTELWSKGDVNALPKGYLICGPVGTGKTFLVECLAGEAGVPIVKLKNFRDKWVGSTEGNLEKIFRLLHALGRCYVFIDEADQALGKRESSEGDSGLSGRVYSMIAEEMGSSASRGQIIWVLASSRPDLIEIDLKRPGRVDVKIPLLPCATSEEGFHLLRMLCGRHGVAIQEQLFEAVKTSVPNLLTPGAAEALAVKIYRIVRTTGQDSARVFAECLRDYQNPIPRSVLDVQIQLAIREATDLDFVPSTFRNRACSESSKRTDSQNNYCSSSY